MPRQPKVVTSLSYRELKKKVSSKLGKRAVRAMVRYVNQHDPNLWGAVKLRKFTEKSVVLALYKDMKNIGYGALKSTVSNWYNPTVKSISHNTKQIRSVLEQWGQQQVKLGKKKNWVSARDAAQLPKSCSDTALWMDDTDFPLEGKRKVSRRHFSWSWKLNGPGTRFMLMTDARGYIRKLWGGYSPKLYSGHFPIQKRKWFSRNIPKKGKGVAIIADQHFEYAKKHMPQFRWHITSAKEDPEYEDLASDVGSDDEEVEAEILAKYRKDVQRTRSRVESPFGIIKGKWKALRVPFAEGEIEQAKVVWIAVGVHNFTLK